jgi:hypothetical protein
MYFLVGSYLCARKVGSVVAFVLLPQVRQIVGIALAYHGAREQGFVCASDYSRGACMLG